MQSSRDESAQPYGPQRRRPLDGVQPKVIGVPSPLPRHHYLITIISSPLRALAPERSGPCDHNLRIAAPIITVR